MPLTKPGLSLCPLFTVTVIRPMEAQQRGVCSHCPAQDCQPLSGHTEPRTRRKRGVVGGAPGGFDLTNLATRMRERENECKTIRERDRGKRKWEREREEDV